MKIKKPSSLTFFDQFKDGPAYCFNDHSFSYTQLTTEVTNHAQFLKELSHDIYQLELNQDFFYPTLFMAAALSNKTLIPVKKLKPNFPELKIKELKEKTTFEELIFSEFPLDFPFLGLFSSATTGQAKLQAFTLENIFSSALASIEFYKMSPGDKHLLSLPLHHIGGHMIYWRCFLSGGTLGSNDPNFQSSQDYCSMVPTQVLRNIHNENLKSYKAIIVGGDKLDAKTATLAKSKELPLSLSYGLTESTAQVMATKAGDIEYQKVGRPLSHVNTHLDESKIILSGPSISNWTIENLKLKRLDKTELKTQDFAQEKEGRFFILGRADDMFISGGENISPKEIEMICMNHESIEFAKLIKVPSCEYGHVGELLYFGDLDLERLKEHLSQELENYKMPKKFHRLKSLPSFKLTFENYMDFI